MPAWVCVTCGVQQSDTEHPPQTCPICEDERQYVGWDGQRWTTVAELAADHHVVLREEEPDLVGIGVEPAVAIGQRALLVRTPRGNVLWDAIPLIDGASYAAVHDLGGVDAICMSHRTSTPPTSSGPTPSTPASSSRPPTRNGSSVLRRGSSCSTSPST